MSPLGVEKHQRLIRRQTTQCCGSDVIRSICDGRPWEIERGCHRGERFSQLPGALLGQCGRCEHVDWRDCVETGAILHACTGDHDIYQSTFIRRCGLLCMSSCGHDECDGSRNL